jgi:hypothetical protein
MDELTINVLKKMVGEDIKPESRMGGQEEKEVKEKKFSFDYIGENKQGKHFCIVTDDGEGNGIGISTCYHYYVLKADGSIKQYNTMFIPMFYKRPGAEEAAAVLDRVTKFFNGWIPYNMEIVNPEEGK